MTGGPTWPDDVTYTWQIERRDDGKFYAVQQFGGWMRFPGKGEAEDYVNRQVRLGDNYKEES